MTRLFGTKALLDQIKFDKEHISVVHLFKDNKKLINELKFNNIKFKIHHDKNWFKQFDKNLNHQFVVIEIQNNNKVKTLESFLENNKTKTKSIILIVDSIQDPHNFGSILRTCDAFGVDAVIYKSDNQVQINDFVSKTSMGAINTLNIFKVVNLSRAIELLKKYGYWIYASMLDEKSQSNNDVDYSDKSVIIIGNEQSGINKLIAKNSDQSIIIKMYGKLQSLNVAVATGILLYEARNKKKKKKK